MNYGLFGQSAADELRPFLAASHGMDYEQFRGWRAQSAAGWIASCSGGGGRRMNYGLFGQCAADGLQSCSEGGGGELRPF